MPKTKRGGKKGGSKGTNKRAHGDDADDETTTARKVLKTTDGTAASGFVSQEQQDSDDGAVSFESASGDSDSDSDGDDVAASHSNQRTDFVSMLEGATSRAKAQLGKSKNGGSGRKRKLAEARGTGTGAPSSQAPKRSRSVVYLGHIPHGFYEDQMRGYFSQFGEIARLRLSRNKKTGRSKHYAFIEFASREVAKIVAGTMNGYFLAGRRLVCHLVKSKDVHERMFVGANKKFRPIPWRLIARQTHNRPKTSEQRAKQVKRLVSREQRKREKLKALGIDYDFPGYAAAAAASAAAIAEAGASSIQRAEEEEAVEKQDVVVQQQQGKQAGGVGGRAKKGKSKGKGKGKGKSKSSPKRKRES